MRVVVIGGTGHIGSFLVPRLVRAGHEVISLSRGVREPYASAAEWQDVRAETVDRTAEDRAGTFPRRVAGFDADAVIDLICFSVGAAQALVAALRGRTNHLVHCGSIWRHGPSRILPVREDDPTPPLGEYGIAKAAIAALLKRETASGGLVTTSLHPGHIVGPGWPPIGPLGNLDPEVWRRLSAGEPLDVPGLGTELMHHVHADDVAQGFERALDDPEAAAGEDFTLVAPSALTVRGYAEAAASWFGRDPHLRFVTWPQFRATTGADDYDCSWDHLERNHYCSIDKARTRLGYAPAYEPDEAIHESVRWLIEHDRLDVAAPLRADTSTSDR